MLFGILLHKVSVIVLGQVSKDVRELEETVLIFQGPIEVDSLVLGNIDASILKRDFL